jgi:transglutaminase-like putative cysteine protease
MRLRIEHITTFTYDQPIMEAYTEMRLKPLDADGQHTVAFSLQTEPHDEILKYTDRFGNEVHHFDVIQPHQRLVVAARSEVLTPDRFSAVESRLSPLDVYDYLMASDYVTITPEVEKFAEAYCSVCSPADTAYGIMHAIHNALKYEKGATDVTTNAAQALELGRGVCQDFAHLMLAACRSRGIPARYVSGYLFNNGNSSATHAWVDVYLPDYGWISLDPTHDLEQSAYYVRLAVGRDYADVPPTLGVFVGNAREAMDVSVTVKSV